MTTFGRTRNRSTIYPRRDYSLFLGYGTAAHGFPNYPTVPYVSSTTTAGQETEVTEDWSHDHFTRRINNGEIICSPFRTTKVVETNSPPGVFEHIYERSDTTLCTQHTPSQYHKTRVKEKGTWRPGSPAAIGFASGVTRAGLRQSVIDQAVISANANIDISEMLALATAAESRKTVESMRAILWRVFKIMKSVRKLHLRELYRELTPKEVADRYMEARYAIRPLIYDVRGILSSLEKRREHVRRTFRGEASDSHTNMDSVGHNPGLSYITSTWGRCLEYTVSARAGVLCDIEVSEISTFGLDQIAETAWELVPFSFIVDWFTNCGDWIAAQTPNAGVNQRASWVTVKETLTTTQNCISAVSTASSNSGWSNVSLTFPSVTWSRKEEVLERIVDPTTNVFPSVDINLDAFKLTDMGIILRNLTK